MKREYEDYLRDMLENAEKALSFVEGMVTTGFARMIKPYAVTWALEIMGKPPVKFLNTFVNQILKFSGATLLPCRIN